MAQRCGHLRRDLIYKLRDTIKSLGQKYLKMRYQVWQTALNPSFLRELGERGNSLAQGLAPVRGRDTAAPETLYDVPNLN